MYTFRLIEKQEIPEFFALITKRMAWLDKKHLKGWNIYHYDEIFPLSYFQAMASSLYVLVSDHVVCGALLLESDQRWNDYCSALYVHNFVSEVGSRSGRSFLRYVEAYAVSKGKKYLRLDSDIHNEDLASYYHDLGFEDCGFCWEGDYQGVLRQKKLIHH